MKRPARGGQPVLLALLLAGACLVAGGGCDSQTAQQAAQNQSQRGKPLTDAERRKRAEDARRQPFEIKPLAPLLSESLLDVQTGATLRLAKPGHWTAAVQSMESNFKDFEGRTTIAAVDGRGQLLPLPRTPFALTSSRPAVLAKGRAKRVESELLIPAKVDKLRVSSEIVDSASGAAISTAAQPWTLMPSHQYFLLVLAREPARYAFLQVTDSVRAPYEDDAGQAPPHYRVVLADAAKPLPLPPNVLAWTSVAYLVWDEVNLQRMDPAQQQALVDWLHWGGRLIVSGPDSLDSLRGSFLGKYLPVDAGETRLVTADDVAPLSEAWGAALAPIAVTRPWSAIELKPRPHAVELPGAAGLAYEGPVGAGSIVVSAMQLAERDLVNWPGFDNFLNGALLRRPGRVFRVEQEGAWGGLQTDWAVYPNRTRDAYFTTPLRWFARDAGTQANVRQAPPPVGPTPQSPLGGPLQPGASAAPGGWAAPEPETIVDRPGGLGDWNAFGPVSRAAREVLREAAGVRVPAASFVVACLAVYLLVLVPLNWMVFHALKRVEWAWIAAPIIAMLGTVAVVRQAQLDIGFVRSHTEIALLELQGDLPRGHLSRYTALYSSLSTTYDMAFDDQTAVATPFPSRADFQAAIGDSRRVVTFEKYDKPRLRGVPVSSASTQLIHSEQMFPLAGPVRLTSPSADPKLKQLENNSGYELSDAVVVHRRFDDAGRETFEGCWLGQVRSGGSVLLAWGALRQQKGRPPYATERQRAAAIDYRQRLDVDALLKLAFTFPPASDPLHGRRDEYRLVARIDEVLPGAVATPSASQTTGATVVLAHLRLELAPAPTPDVNSPQDVAPNRDRRDYDEFIEAPLED